MMAHHVDEFQGWAMRCGVGPEEAMKILDEEIELQKSSLEYVDVFRRARQRIIDKK